MMSPTDCGAAHDLYCRQLVAAQSNDVIIDLIEGGAATPEWWPRGRPLRRTYGKFYPDAAPYLSITLETIDGPQVVANVEAFADAPPDAGWVIRAEPFGFLRVSLATDDRALPSLAALIGLPGSRMVRYRPGQRCVVRVDDGDRTMWAKTFADDRGEIIHHNDLLVWERRDELGFTVAPPGRYDAATRTMWNDHVPGVPVKAVLKGADGSVMAARMGRACGTIPVSSLVPASTNEPLAELERTMIRAAHVASAVPALAGPLDELIGLLEPAFTATVGRPLRAVHGAPHHEQWLTSGVDVGLVDFDGMGFGDPELDVATFQAEVDFEGGIAMGADRICRAFLDGYESSAGPLDRRLLTAYRALKRMHKAARTAQAIRPDGADRAAVHLQRAFDAFA